jgi:polar amino acid transport system substrate-binding protein
MTCLGTIAAVATSLTLAATEPVVIGTDAPFPAYTYVDEAGTITGFERDVMDQICDRARLVCAWELAHFDQLIPGVMSGEFDVVLGGMAVNDERRMLVDFTQSYYGTDPEEWYIGRPGAAPPASALTAVQSGTVHEAHLRRLGLRYKSYTTEPEVLEALRSGAVDLALGPFETRPDIEDYVKANGLDFLYSDMIPDDGVAMAVCKGNTDLLDTLNAALDAMRADGTLATLESRWFN